MGRRGGGGGGGGHAMPLRRLLRYRCSEIAFDAIFGLKLVTNLMRTFSHVALKRHSLLLCLVSSQCGQATFLLH